jgi:hypothetical protein
MIVVMVTAAFLLGACGSSKSSTSPGTGTNTTTTAASGGSPTTSPAGDIPDTQAYVVQTAPGGTFTIKVPEGWAQTMTGTAVSFTDKLNTIRFETMPAATAPTVASAVAAELPRIAQSASQYQAGKVSLVQRTSGPAVLITYTATSAANPVTGKTIRLAVQRYEFWKNGTEAIVTVSGPVAADNVDPWKLVTDSFTWK